MELWQRFDLPSPPIKCLLSWTDIPAYSTVPSGSQGLPNVVKSVMNSLIKNEINLFICAFSPNAKEATCTEKNMSRVYANHPPWKRWQTRDCFHSNSASTSRTGNGTRSWRAIWGEIWRAWNQLCLPLGTLDKCCIETGEEWWLLTTNILLVVNRIRVNLIWYVWRAKRDWFESTSTEMQWLLHNIEFA